VIRTFFWKEPWDRAPPRLAKISSGSSMRPMRLRGRVVAFRRPSMPTPSRAGAPRCAASPRSATFHVHRRRTMRGSARKQSAESRSSRVPFATWREIVVAGATTMMSRCARARCGPCCRHTRVHSPYARCRRAPARRRRMKRQRPRHDTRSRRRPDKGASARPP